MSVTEILLLILGAVIFAAGFIVPEAKGKKNKEQLAAPDLSGVQDEIRRMADQTIDETRRRINEIVTMECGIAQDDTQRTMERITNDKIMAINEYGKTVTDEIERNHKEVLFLYDMLNDKTADIKNTVRKIDSVTSAAPARQPAPAPAPAPVPAPAPAPAPAPVSAPQAAAPQIKPAAPAPAPVKPQEHSIKIPRMFAPTSFEGIIPEKKEEAPVSPAAAEPAAAQARASSRVLELHQSGMSDVDIARELGIGVGEVRLKIDLAGKVQ